jgi:hypothetical protein
MIRLLRKLKGPNTCFLFQTPGFDVQIQGESGKKDTHDHPAQRRADKNGAEIGRPDLVETFKFKLFNFLFCNVIQSSIFAPNFFKKQLKFNSSCLQS